MPIIPRPTRTGFLAPPWSAALLIVAAPLAFGSAASAHEDASGALEVQVAADKFGTVNRQTGEVTVTGTIVCSKPANAFVTNTRPRSTTARSRTADGLQPRLLADGHRVRRTITPCCGPAFTPGKADLTTAAYAFDERLGTARQRHAAPRRPPQEGEAVARATDHPGSRRTAPGDRRVGGDLPSGP